MSDEAVHALVSGIVQGVGYRAWTQRNARELGLSGWVRNLDDGRVELYAAGPAAAVRELVRRCHRGPSSAAVETVQASPVALELALVGFEARRTAAAPAVLPPPA
jgi:acylphosphatase